MDPLTHTLLGANLAVTAPARRVRLAGPALVVGANLPDVDVLSYLAGSDFALGFRRGWTHGWPALVVLPCLLWVALLLWDRARPSGGAGGAARGSPRRLFGFCYAATLTHPCLDWLNTYGMRWRMPLDGTWSYGDSVFIVDPWLWLLLGAAWLSRKRPGAGRRAIAGLLAAALYVAALLSLHALTEARVRAGLAAPVAAPSTDLMVGPRPVNPLVWDVVARADGRYLVGIYRWHGGGLAVDRELADARADPRWAVIEAAAARQVPGFLGWARFPWLEVDDAGAGELDVYLMDARYRRRRTTGFGGARIRIPR